MLKDDYSTRLLCETLDVHRSNLSHPPRPSEDRPLMDALKEWAGQWPTDGYRRLTLMLRRQGHPVNHSDQRVQDAAMAYVESLTAASAQISMASVGEPEENGYAERLMRTIKEEEVALTEYEDFADARSQLGMFIDDVYNTKRIHSSLGYLTPGEFEQQWISTKGSQ